MSDVVIRAEILGRVASLLEVGMGLT